MKSKRIETVGEWVEPRDCLECGDYAITERDHRDYHVCRRVSPRYSGVIYDFFGQDSVPYFCPKKYGFDGADVEDGKYRFYHVRDGKKVYARKRK